MQYDKILADAKSERDWIVDVRRRIHRRPEIGFDLVETNRLVTNVLGELQVEHRSGIAETGVVATIGSGDGPCVALRADMDALPMQEEADVDFRSEIDGRMHACGHDCHTAMLLGAAKLLKGREADLPGTVKLIFQPAEEGGAGGDRMCQEGALESPKVDRIFGLHVWPYLPTGSVAGRSGPLLAAAGELEITVHGRGGHAAMPHACIDPVVTSAKIILELQTIVSREIDPLESGVVSITQTHGGSASNVIPPSVQLRGTVRSLTMDGFRFLQKRVTEIATAVAEVNGCTAEVTFPGHDYPPVVNDEGLWEFARGVAGEIVGSEAVEEMPPVMGGEDFAFYTQQVPGCFAVVGVGNPEKGTGHGLHHPKFVVDEDGLPYGTALHVAFALGSLETAD